MPLAQFRETMARGLFSNLLEWNVRQLTA